MITLPANNAAYTAIVRGFNNLTGIGLVEAYDLDRTVNSRLGNISTRGQVQTGNNVLIAGTFDAIKATFPSRNSRVGSCRFAAPKGNDGPMARTITRCDGLPSTIDFLSAVATALCLRVYSGAP